MQLNDHNTRGETRDHPISLSLSFFLSRSYVLRNKTVNYAASFFSQIRPHLSLYRCSLTDEPWNERHRGYIGPGPISLLQFTNIQKKRRKGNISRAKEMVVFGLQALIPILSMYATIALLSVQGI